jgi:hypothetical protein
MQHLLLQVNGVNINTMYLQTTTFTTFSNNVSSTLGSILTKNASQDTEINNIKSTIPTLLSTN